MRRQRSIRVLPFVPGEDIKAGEDSAAPPQREEDERGARDVPEAPPSCLDAPITVASPPAAVVIEEPASAEDTKGGVDPGAPTREITRAADGAAAAATATAGAGEEESDAAGVTTGRAPGPSNAPCRVAYDAASRNDWRDETVEDLGLGALGSAVGTEPPGCCGGGAAGASPGDPSASRVGGVAEGTGVEAAASPAAPGTGSHAGATTKKRGRAQGAPATDGDLPGGGVESFCVAGPGVPAGEARQPPMKKIATATTATMMMTPKIAVVSTPETVTSVWDLDSEEEEEDDDDDDGEEEDEGRGGEEDARDSPAMRRSGQRVVVGSDEPRARGRLTTVDPAPRSMRTKTSTLSEPRPEAPSRETPVSCGERGQEIDEAGGGAPAPGGGGGAAGAVNGGHAALSPPEVEEEEEKEEALVVARTSDRARQLMPPPPPNVTRAKMRRRRSRVTLMHSPK